MLTEQFSKGLLASGVDVEAGAELVPLGDDCVGLETGVDTGGAEAPGLREVSKNKARKLLRNSLQAL